MASPSSNTSPSFTTAAPSNPVTLASPPPQFLAPQGFQAAKYFSYIFFAVAVTVIGMFACLVCYHMLVRRRTARLRQRHISDFRAPQNQSVRPREIPLKEGFLVHNPNGATLVAWDPEGPNLKPSLEEQQPAAAAQPGPAPAASPGQPSATQQQQDDSAAVALEEGRLSRGLQAEHANLEMVHRLHMASSQTY